MKNRKSKAIVNCLVNFLKKKKTLEKYVKVLKERIVQLETGTIGHAQIVQRAIAAALEICVKGNAIATGIRRHMLRVRVETQRSLQYAVQRLA